MIAIRLALAAVLVGLALPTSATAWEIVQVTATETASEHPRVHFDGLDRPHVIWQEAGEIRHRAFVDGAWLPVATIGVGDEISTEACSHCNELLLTWTGPDDRIHFRRWRNNVWLGEQTLPWVGPGTPGRSCVTKSSLIEVVWTEVQGDLHSIFASRFTAGGWTFPALIATGVPDPWLGEGLSVGVAPSGTDGALQCAWIHGPEFGSPVMRGATFDPVSSLWSPVSDLLPGAGVSLDLSANPLTGELHVVSHAEPPACPCNAVLYFHGYPGAWSAMEVIDVESMYEFEWPHDVRVHSGADGRVHAIWQEDQYASDLSWREECLIYSERDMVGDWTPDVYFCRGRGALDPHVTASFEAEPALVWSDVSDGNRNLYLATTQALLDAPEVALTPGALAVVVSPQPSRDRVRFTVRAAGTDPVEVRVFDGAGRAVTTLRDDGGVSGRRNLSWDGRDERGRTATPGVYFARIRSGRSIINQRVVLLD